MTIYRVQVWAFCGYEMKPVPYTFGVFVFAVPVLRWIDVYAGPDATEAEICRDVYAAQVEHVRLLKLEKVPA